MSQLAGGDPECGAQDIVQLLTDVYEKYQIDFRDYALSSITRRVTNCMRGEGISTLEQYRQRLVTDADCMERLLRAFTVHVTTMFRDPEFYRAVREQVIPVLEERPFFRIWHAGCSTGEEAYSLAILLEEAGLRVKSRIYATDISEGVLRRAREGIFPLTAIREFTRNYIKAGGAESFSRYYTASYDRAILNHSLRENIVFSRHNLASDGPFNTFDVVLCRNVLIYFNEKLAQRAHRLFYDSLFSGGFLGLGSRETIEYTPYESHYEQIDATARLFRKLR